MRNGDLVLIKGQIKTVPAGYRDGAFEVITEAVELLTGTRKINDKLVVSARGIGYVRPEGLEVIG